VTGLRDTVSQVLGAELPARPGHSPAPGLVFANVVRFCESPARGIVDFVSAAREFPRFKFEACHFDVLSTDKVLRSAATVVHDRIRFGGQPASGSSQ
jgi:hypothetical protein